LQEDQDWGIVAMVLDRLFLWMFGAAAVVGKILHRKKSFSIFPFPAGMSLTKLSRGGHYDVIHKVFLPRERLVSDIPSGVGNIEKLFLRCSY
jgi:hypothetical protein